MPNMPNYNELISTNNLSPNQIRKLDLMMSDYNVRYAFEYFINNLSDALNNKDKLIAQGQEKLDATIKKYEDIISIKKIRVPKSFRMSSYQNLDLAKVNLVDLKNAYEADCLVAADNEEIIKENTAIIDSIVKTMECAGISKTTTKFKSARSSKQITVNATWYEEIRTLYISKHNLSYQYFEKKTLDASYNNIESKVKAFHLTELETKEKALVAEKIEGEKVRLAKQEAILIAHTCINFGFDPITVTTRDELDKRLVEIGQVPSSVINALKKELNFA